MFMPYPKSPHMRIELTLGNAILDDAKTFEGRKKTIIILKSAWMYH